MMIGMGMPGNKDTQSLITVPRGRLKAATKDCYRADEYMTKLVETSTNIDAKGE